MYNFELTELLFTKLLLAITGILPDSDIFLIHTFVYVGEPKLAIETVAAAFYEENKCATPEIISLVHDLAVAMNYDPEIYTSKLHLEYRSTNTKNENVAHEKVVFDFEFIELCFIKLLPVLKSMFYDLEMSLIRMYVDAGRYEIALNTVIFIFIEKKKTATPEIISIVKDLAIAMKCDPEIYISRLRVEQ